MSNKSAKKFIACALILALAASLVLFFAACGEEEDNTDYGYFSFSYSSDLGGLVLERVVNVSAMPKAVNIPTGYYADGGSRDTKILVVAIADNAFENCTKITSVTLPDSVKSIGGSAFNGCISLTGINLDNVHSIGKNAFRNCKKLTSVTFSSESFTNISDGAFSGCLSLRTVNGDSKIKSIGKDAFRACTALMTIENDLSALTSIGSGAFFYTGCLTTFDIPSACSSVKGYAFEGWTEYQTVYYTAASGWDADWNQGAPETVFVQK